MLLASGKTAAIASLKPGDKILATNTKTGKTQAETVTAVEVNHDTDLYDLTVKTAHGTAVIHTTSNHLFWDPAARAWVEAAKLRKGEPLKTADGTTATAYGGTTPKQYGGWMWDLTVPGNGDHDFYVAADDQGDMLVLVHNDDPPSPADIKFARSVNLPADSPAFLNRNMPVPDFIAQFRKGGVRQVLGRQYMDMTVGEALKAAKANNDSLARKMLVDSRFDINSNYKGKIC